MNKTKEIKADIEKQRKKLDELAAKAVHLTELLEEARTMDLLIESYEEYMKTV